MSSTALCTFLLQSSNQRQPQGARPRFAVQRARASSSASASSCCHSSSPQCSSRMTRRCPMASASARLNSKSIGPWESCISVRISTTLMWKQEGARRWPQHQHSPGASGLSQCTPKPDARSVRNTQAREKASWVFATETAWSHSSLYLPGKETMQSRAFSFTRPEKAMRLEARPKPWRFASL